MGRPWPLPPARADGAPTCRGLAKRCFDRSAPIRSGGAADDQHGTGKSSGTALITTSPDGLRDPSVALAFQLRAIPKSALQKKIRDLTEEEVAELELATDEALGRVEPQPK